MYKFKAEVSEMSIDGEIDQYWGESLRYIDYDLQNSKDVKIFLNSGGGSVTEGFAIADRLRRHSQNNSVEIVVSGLCASIATMIHAAGTVGSRKMTANSFYMIHNTSVWAEGGSKELRSLADTLDTMSNRIAENYVDVIESNGKLINGSREETKAQVIAWMDNETWFSAEKALEVGLIDAIETAQTYITPDTAPALKNQIRNCVNVPAELMKEIENNITAEEKTMFQKFLAFLGFEPKAECTPKKEEEQVKIENQIKNQNPDNMEMTKEDLIKKASQMGFNVTEEESEEPEVTEEELIKQAKAMGLKLTKAETAENKTEAEIKALREEVARLKLEQKKPQVTERRETPENLSRKDRALQEFAAKNEKMLSDAAEFIESKLNG